MSQYTYHLEVDFIHPALAHQLAQRGGEWLYEYTFHNQRRIDFIEKLNGVTSLIECKPRLRPVADIEQINSYHRLYGDPKALKVLAIPRSAYRARVICKYDAYNISILLIDGDFSDSAVMPIMKRGAYRCVPTLYPNNCNRVFTGEEETAMTNIYNYAPKSRPRSDKLRQPREIAPIVEPLPAAPPAPFARVLSPDQERMEYLWGETYNEMMEAVAQGQFAKADEWLTLLREQEAALGYRPKTLEKAANR